MGQLLDNSSLQICHENIIAVVQGPNVFVSVFAAIRDRWAAIGAQMSRCINDIFPVFGKKSTCAPSFACADHFVFEFICGFLWNFANEYLVAHQTFFCVGSLKNDVLAIKTPVCLGIITANRELLNVSKMVFIGV